MKEGAIIIEGIRYVIQHIVLYCPIVNEVKKQKQYGLSLVLNGLGGQKIQILFDSKDERDKKLAELDAHFGLNTKITDNVKSINDFLKLEAEKSGYLVDAIT